MKISRITVALAVVLAITGCQTAKDWHEIITAKTDPVVIKIGDAMGLEQEQPIEQSSVDAPQTQTVVIDQPATPEQPSAPAEPQDGPSLPAKSYPGTVEVLDARTWLLTNDPGGWTDIGAMSWDGAHWGGCAGAVIVGRNDAARKIKIEWSEYTPIGGCLVVVWTDNSTGRPKNVWAKWVEDVM